MLILKRNAMRDYLNFAALSERIGLERAKKALDSLDQLYPQPSGESALQQLQAQLANPMPYDLEGTDLSEYLRLHPRWHDWEESRKQAPQLVSASFSISEVGAFRPTNRHAKGSSPVGAFKIN